MEPESPNATVSASVEVELEPSEVFAIVADELPAALASRGIARDGSFEIGRVTVWEPGRELALEWRPASWEPETTTEVSATFEPGATGTRITVEQRGWGGFLGGWDEIAGWFAGELVAPLLAATSPSAFGDWLTDRRARRPAGEQARATYADPLFHRPNFVVLLELLALRP